MRKVIPKVDSNPISELKRPPSRPLRDNSARRVRMSSADSSEPDPDQLVSSIIKLRTSQQLQLPPNQKITLKDLCPEERQKIGKLITKLEDERQNGQRLNAALLSAKANHESDVSFLKGLNQDLQDKLAALDIEHKRVLKLLEFYQCQTEESGIQPDKNKPEILTNSPLRSNIQKSYPPTKLSKAKSPTTAKKISPENRINEEASKTGLEMADQQRNKNRRFLTIETGKAITELGLFVQPSAQEFSPVAQPLTKVSDNIPNEEVQHLNPQIAEGLKNKKGITKGDPTTFTQENQLERSDFSIHRIYKNLVQKSNLPSPAPKQVQPAQDTLKEIICVPIYSNNISKRPEAITKASEVSEKIERLKREKEALDQKKISNALNRRRLSSESSENSDDDVFATAMKVLKGKNAQMKNQPAPSRPPNSKQSALKDAKQVPVAEKSNLNADKNREQVRVSREPGKSDRQGDDGKLIRPDQTVKP